MLLNLCILLDMLLDLFLLVQFNFTHEPLALAWLRDLYTSSTTKYSRCTMLIIPWLKRSRTAERRENTEREQWLPENRGTKGNWCISLPQLLLQPFGFCVAMRLLSRRDFKLLGDFLACYSTHRLSQIRNGIRERSLLHR